MMVNGGGVMEWEERSVCEVMEGCCVCVTSDE